MLLSSTYHYLFFTILLVLTLQIIGDDKNKWPNRSFPKYNHTFPCYYKDGDFVGCGKDMRGLVYIKVPKTGSTTLAGINLRISHRHRHRHSNTTAETSTSTKPCSATYHHARAYDLGARKRQKDKTFLWTFLREPISQIKSFFFWENRLYIGRPRHYAPSFTHFQTFIYQSYRDFNQYPQVGYVSPYKLTLKDLKGNKTLVQEILYNYDFIGLMERFDDSLVVLRLILGLNAGDILYTKSKKNGGYDAGASGVCRKVTRKREFSENEEFFKSAFWTQRNVLINQLYSAANRSLDLTIDNVIGRDRFEQALSYHNYLMHKVNLKCEDSIVFPCSQQGLYQMNESDKNCYKFDLGCGYPCFDYIVDQQALDANGYKQYKKNLKSQEKTKKYVYKKHAVPKKTQQRQEWNKEQQWNQKNKDAFQGGSVKTYNSIDDNNTNENNYYDMKDTVLFLTINWIVAYFLIRLFISKPIAKLRHRRRGKSVLNLMNKGSIINGWENDSAAKGSDVDDGV